MLSAAHSIPSCKAGAGGGQWTTRVAGTFVDVTLLFRLMQTTDSPDQRGQESRTCAIVRKEYTWTFHLHL